MSLNSKFDLVRDRVLGHRPIPSLMDVCFEVWLEEDRTNAINIVTVSDIDSATFNAKFSSSDHEKQNGKPVLVCEHGKKLGHKKDNCWKLHD